MPLIPAVTRIPEVFPPVHLLRSTETLAAQRENMQKSALRDPLLLLPPPCLIIQGTYTYQKKKRESYWKLHHGARTERSVPKGKIAFPWKHERCNKYKYMLEGFLIFRLGGGLPVLPPPPPLPPPTPCDMQLIHSG